MAKQYRRAKWDQKELCEHWRTSENKISFRKAAAKHKSTHSDYASGKVEVVAGLGQHQFSQSQRSKGL